MTREVGKARGILRSPPEPGIFHHARVAPSPALAGIVQHFWIVRWDLRGHEPRRPETLPHPNVHLVLEPGRTRIHGVHTGRFTRVLAGQGGVFGVKFRPSGFRSFLGRPVSTLRNRSAALCDVFGPDAARLESEIFTHSEDSAMIALAERFFLSRLPPPDRDVDRVGEIVDGIAADRGITTVEQVTERWHQGKRTLQRLFNEYVGVWPRWVISRYRLHEVIESLSGDGPADWTQLALELGYFDQAHFIRDFKAPGRPSAGGLCARPVSHSRLLVEAASQILGEPAIARALVMATAIQIVEADRVRLPEFVVYGAPAFGRVL